jgi:hypothetical protein
MAYVSTETIRIWREGVEANKAAPKGTTIICPVCKTAVVKKRPAQAFCGRDVRGTTSCSQRYNNCIRSLPAPDWAARPSEIDE